MWARVLQGDRSGHHSETLAFHSTNENVRRLRCGFLFLGCKMPIAVVGCMKGTLTQQHLLVPVDWAFDPFGWDWAGVHWITK